MAILLLRTLTVSVEAAEMRVELACGSQLWLDEFRNLGAEHGWYSKEIIESRLEWA